MKAIFSMLSAILLSFTGLCLEASADLTLQQMQNKMDGATLIPGLNIRKGDMIKVGKNDFRHIGKSKFILMRQFDSTCGTTSAEMVLHYYGQDVGQREIWDTGNVHVIEFGTFPAEVELALDRLGVPSDWFVGHLEGATLENLKRWVREDRPPIILLRFGEVLHYVVVVGYNSQGDFLLADPNYRFIWMPANVLRFGWSLDSPGLPNVDYPVEDGFESFGLEILARAVDVLTGGENVIVPHAPPSKQFLPNYDAVPIKNGQFMEGGRAVRGGNRFNPTWTTDPWEETFTFIENIVDYRVSSVVPVEFENLGGLETAYIQGHKKVDNRTVKVWGRITPGKITKGRIFLFVQGYKSPLSGSIQTRTNTQRRHYSSSWGPIAKARYAWHSFTFPGEVMNYTISSEVSFFDRLRAELITHRKNGNRVEFQIMLRDHLAEKNEIAVYVTAHYEPPTPGRFELSYDGSRYDIPSGKPKTMRVTVYSTRGARMPEVRVQFLDTDDSEIAFSRTSVTTNSSGVATSTMKTGSWGNADFTIRVDGLPDKRYTASVAKILKEHVEKRWFSSRHAGEDCRRVWGVKICNPDLTPDWYTHSGYIDVPSWVSIHSYSLSKHVPVEDRLTAPYVKKHWRSGNRVHLEIRFREHIFESNDILVKVHAKYWGGAASPGAPVKPEVRPDPERVATVWQELSHVPARTALLPNYPNPFNPETWIPYHLAEPADVTLTIYCTNGRFVRKLALGYQPAGVYERKGRAAYWDGRNVVGERVASGLYFYTLTAGDFAATGKMLIMK